MIEEGVNTPAKLMAWLEGAEAGEQIQYFLGKLDSARHIQKISKSKHDDILCADYARHAERRGWVDLVQKRIGSDLYSYLAIKREN